MPAPMRRQVGATVLVRASPPDSNLETFEPPAPKISYSGHIAVNVPSLFARIISSAATGFSLLWIKSFSSAVMGIKDSADP
uniref:Uncharacterized protein n=1 Tax=uncultured marine virus TaxID=186617 RepID=A0A0F7L3D8_9VIRU|nr:hypothetical protein [uncultured marine virus]